MSGIITEGQQDISMARGAGVQCWPTAIMALRAGDQELAPSRAGGKPVPKGQHCDQLEGDHKVREPVREAGLG